MEKLQPQKPKQFVLRNHVAHFLYQEVVQGFIMYPHILRKICSVKYANRSNRKRTNNHILCAEKCGDLITADPKILNEEGESRNNDRYAEIVHDLASSSIRMLIRR